MHDYPKGNYEGLHEAMSIFTDSVFTIVQILIKSGDWTFIKDLLTTEMDQFIPHIDIIL